MTAVLNIKKFNKKDFDLKSIKRLEAHNIRNDDFVAKDNIDPSRQHLDQIFIKTNDLENLFKEAPRKNSLLSVGFLFDFQNLTQEQKDNFNVELHYEMIQDFMKNEMGLTDYKIIGSSFHGSETNPHFHIEVSGKNNNGNWDLNKFLNYDKSGNKINGASLIQEKWKKFLEEQTNYQNKKEVSSILQFPSRVWRRFTAEQKEAVYDIREATKDRREAKNDGDNKLFKKITDYIKGEVLELLDIALDIDDGIEQEQKKFKGMRK